MFCIQNIGELVLVPPGPVGGRSMRDVQRVSSAALIIDDGRITWFGSESEANISAACECYDAGGGCVTPGLIDCHTHTVFAGMREREFVQRLENRSYADIAQSGGGIPVTVDAVRRCSRRELVDLALPRFRRMLANGVTTVETKSGYGLTVNDEFKMLEAIGDLKSLQPIEPIATYLAAHTTPAEFADANEYLELVFDDKVLTKIRDENLAEFCDVFCDATAFDIYQSFRVLEAGKRYGLTPKIHADQFAGMDASVLAAQVGAISADHLDKIDDAGIAAMSRSRCIGVLLPGTSYFLSQPQAPARQIMEADVPVAVATNYNPGSSMIESLPLVMNIACTQMRITPIEALVAVTANAAAAVNRHDRVGALAKGMQADLVVLDVASPEQWVYEPGRNCVRAVFKRGELVHSIPS